MKQLFIKRGVPLLQDVPAPSVEPGFLLVRATHSCISSGTELSGVRNSAQPLWKRALQHPEEVRRVVEMATTQGLARTRSIVQGRLAEGLAVGYSAAGVVTAVGDGIEGFSIGDRVACAGAGYASHAEIIRVPKNLCCRVPPELPMSVASTVALGAIALQGVRRALPSLGETVVVVGLGALGQLTAQLLRANGCHVIGVDLNAERIAKAIGLGLDYGISPSDGDAILKVWRKTRDAGADAVVITASSPDDEILSNSFKMCRRRGRVVVVGDVGLNIHRQDIYEKELDFFISTSYGPGRYDTEYEEKGLKYPISYVRWTETRNMEEYLALAATSRIHVDELIGGEFSFHSPEAAYDALASASGAPILAVLKHDEHTESVAKVTHNPSSFSTVANGRIRVAVIGPGGFVRAVHLPNLAAMSDLYELRAIVGRSVPKAASVAAQFGAPYASTDFDEVLRDRNVDAVLVSTRHDRHCEETLRALRAGKHVFVEKPLVTTPAGIEEVAAFFQGGDDPKPLLLTGFNRRFSTYLRRIRRCVEKRASPMVVNYRMNAGFIPAEHWVHGEEGGGRNIGEACHIYDLFTYLTDARAISVSAHAIPPPSGVRGRSDNFIATIAFEDQSICSLTYTSLGHPNLPKERLELFFDGNALVMDDYKELRVHGIKGVDLKTRLSEKGHVEEIREFATGIREGRWPIPLWQQLQAMQIAFAVQGQLNAGEPQ